MANEETDKTKMNVSDGKSPVPDVYIFNAYFDQGKIASKLTPLVSSIVAVERAETGMSGFSSAQVDNKPVTFRTDKNGRLNSLVSPSDSLVSGKEPLVPHALLHTVTTPKKKVKSFVVVPPVDAISFLAAAKVGDGARWTKDLIEALGKFKPPGGLEPLTLNPNIQFTNLKKPKINPKTPEEVDYKIWHTKQKKSKTPIQGYVLAKTRAAIFVFNRDLPIDLDQEIKCETPKGIKQDFPLDQNASSDYLVGVLSGTKVTLPEGLYKLTVTLKSESKKTPKQKKPGPAFKDSQWSNFIKENGSAGANEYQIAVWLKFDISNPAGEFDIVNCDPISVEEAVIKQYPRFYSHLLSAAQDYKNDHEVADPTKKLVTNTDNNVRKPEHGIRAPAKGLVNYWKSWSVIKEKSQLAVKLSARDLGTHVADDGSVYNGKKALSFDIAKALHASFEKSEDKAVKTALDFGFATKDGIDAWDDFAKKKREYASLTASSSWKTALVDEYFRLPINGAADIQTHKSTMIGKLGVPKVATDLFGKAMNVVDLYTSTAAIATTSTKLFTKSIPSSKTAQKNYIEVAADYFKKLGEKEVLASVTIRSVFELNSDALSTAALSEIRTKAPDILKGLQKHEKATVEVAGHTCDLGGIEHNLDLSERRAKEVKKALVKAGLPVGKIKVVGYGETSPLYENISEEKRKLNRRMELTAFAPLQTYDCPAREGMDTLERYRSLSVQKVIEVDDNVIRLALQVTEMAVGVMAVIPVTAPLAAAVIVAQTGYAATLSAGKMLDEWAFGHSLSQFFKDNKRLTTMTRESRANQSLMSDLFKDYETGKKLDAPTEVKWAAQYRLRAEAIAGLVGLLMRAAIGADKKESYDDRLIKYCVEEYIQNFLLGDSWAYPLNGVSLIKMDEYWLHATNNAYCGNEERYQKTKESRFGLSENNLLIKSSPDEKNKTAVAIARSTAVTYNQHNGAYMMTIPPQSHLNDTLSAQFQGYFPIQHFATDSISSFGESFNPVFSNYDRGNFYHTAVYYQDIDSGNWLKYKDHTKWVRAGRNGSRKGFVSISPFTPIRILVVFDNMAGLAPLSFLLKRTDGMNIEGPRYKSMASPLTKRDLISGEDAFEGMVGCVFYPFFSVGQKTFRGIKPMATENALWMYGSAIDYNKGGNLRNMRYSFTCTIGDNDDSELEIPLLSERDGNNGVKADKDWFHAVEDEIHVSIDTAIRPAEKSLLESDFLASNSPKYNYPQLFSGNTKLRVAVRIGGGDAPYLMSQHIGGRYRNKENTNETTTIKSFPVFTIGNSVDEKYQCSIHSVGEVKLEKFEVGFNDFDWDTPVEFVFIATSTELKTEGYEGDTNHCDSRRIPCSVNLCEDNREWSLNTDTVGPKLNMSLEYLGTVTRDKVIAPDFDKIRSSGFEAWIDDGFKFSEDKKKVPERPFRRNQELRPIVEMLKEGGNKARSLVGWTANNASDQYKKRHVYAAHVKCGYLSPKGLEVDSIRPFGTGVFENGSDIDKYIEYFFKNFKSDDGGLEFSTVDCDGGSTFHFNFSTPPSFTEGVPWAKKMPSDLYEKLEGALSKEQKSEFTSDTIKPATVKKWLEEEVTLDFSSVGAFEKILKKSFKG